MNTTLPSDWPPAVDEATSWAAGVAVHIGCDLSAEDRLRAYRLRVLCDLEVSSSRDYWSRKLAEWVGLECGPTAPNWDWIPAIGAGVDGDGAPDGEDWPPSWSISANGDSREFTVPDEDGWYPDATWTPVVGLDCARGADPAAALLLALLAVRP